MVGIVIVSHSQRLAEGVVELARQMAGPDVPIIAAGGICAGTKAGILDLVVPITAEALIPTRPDIIIAPTELHKIRG